MDWTTVTVKRRNRRQIRETEFGSVIRESSTLSELGNKINLKNLDKREYNKHSLETKVLTFLLNPCGLRDSPLPPTNEIRKLIKAKIKEEEHIDLVSSKIFISLCLFHLHNGCSNERLINFPLTIDNKIVNVTACYQKIMLGRPTTFRLHLDFFYEVDRNNINFTLYNPIMDLSKVKLKNPIRKKISNKDAFMVSLLANKNSTKTPIVKTSYAVKTRQIFFKKLKKEVIKPEVIKPEVIKPEVMDEEVIKAEVIKAEVIKAEVIKAEVLEAEEPLIVKRKKVRSVKAKIIFGVPEQEERTRVLDELIETIDISKTNGNSIVKDIEQDVARCGEELREQIIESKFVEMEDMISQKDMLIRHLIQKLDEFKMCNITMDSTIFGLREQNWKLERKILKIQGYDKESICSEHSMRTNYFTPDDYSDMDFDN